MFSGFLLQSPPLPAVPPCCTWALEPLCVTFSAELLFVLTLFPFVQEKELFSTTNAALRIPWFSRGIAFLRFSVNICDYLLPDTHSLTHSPAHPRVHLPCVYRVSVTLLITVPVSRATEDRSSPLSWVGPSQWGKDLCVGLTSLMEWTNFAETLFFPVGNHLEYFFMLSPIWPSLLCIWIKT